MAFSSPGDLSPTSRPGWGGDFPCLQARAAISLPSLPPSCLNLPPPRLQPRTPGVASAPHEPHPGHLSASPTGQSRTRPAQLSLTPAVGWDQPATVPERGQKAAPCVCVSSWCPHSGRAVVQRPPDDPRVRSGKPWTPLSGGLAGPGVREGIPSRSWALSNEAENGTRQEGPGGAAGTCRVPEAGGRVVPGWQVARRWGCV